MTDDDLNERMGARPCAPTDEPLDETLLGPAREYHEPGPAPVEAMWRGIQGGRGGQDGQGGRGGRVLVFRRVVRVALPIAAVLVLGVFLGRMSQDTERGTQDAGQLSPRAQRGDENPSQAMASSAAPQPQSDTGAMTGDRQPASRDARPASRVPSPASVFSVAAERHFAQAESFLTLFRASVREGKDESLAPATARELLVSNRLLMDSPAAQDPKVKRLLEDVELVLAQIAQLPAENRKADAQIINDGLEAGGILTRIRTEVTPGPVAAVPQGAL